MALLVLDGVLLVLVILLALWRIQEFREPARHGDWIPAGRSLKRLSNKSRSRWSA